MHTCRFSKDLEVQLTGRGEGTKLPPLVGGAHLEYPTSTPSDLGRKKDQMGWSAHTVSLQTGWVGLCRDMGYLASR